MPRYARSTPRLDEVRSLPVLKIPVDARQRMKFL